MAKRDGIRISKEMLRQWLMEPGVWKARRWMKEVHTACLACRSAARNPISLS